MNEAFCLRKEKHFFCESFRAAQINSCSWLVLSESELRECEANELPPSVGEDTRKHQRENFRVDEPRWDRWEWKRLVLATCEFMKFLYDEACDLR